MRVLIQELDVITSLAVAPMQFRKGNQHEEQACVLSYSIYQERRHTSDPSQRLKCQTGRGTLMAPSDSQSIKQEGRLQESEWYLCNKKKIY